MKPNCTTDTRQKVTKKPTNATNLSALCIRFWLKTVTKRYSYNYGRLPPSTIHNNNIISFHLL